MYQHTDHKRPSLGRGEKHVTTL